MLRLTFLAVFQPPVAADLLAWGVIWAVAATPRSDASTAGKSISRGAFPERHSKPRQIAWLYAIQFTDDKTALIEHFDPFRQLCSLGTSRT
jgi:hypothetical protein